MILTSAILGLSMRQALSSPERFSMLLWIKMTSSKVTVNSSLLSVELLDKMGMARLLTRLPAVKVTCDDVMPAKSAPSVTI